MTLIPTNGRLEPVTRKPKYLQGVNYGCNTIAQLHLSLFNILVSS